MLSERGNKKIKNYWLHLKTICKHKWFVFLACKDCGIVWRGIKHDLSKFLPVEFIEYAQNYSVGKSPVDACKEKYGCCKSWQHHKGHNTHHWQYWIDYIGVNPIELKMPYLDVVELICDWIGAGKAYNQTKWTQDTPYEYWLNNRDKMRFHNETYEFIDHVLKEIKEYGWDDIAFEIKVGHIYY